VKWPLSRVSGELEGFSWLGKRVIRLTEVELCISLLSPSFHV